MLTTPVWGRILWTTLCVLAANVIWELGLCTFIYERLVLHRFALDSSFFWSPSAAVESLFSPSAHNSGFGNQELVGLAFMLIWAPVAEEIFYCGFLYSAMRQDFSNFSAAMVTGLAFSTCHACRLASIRPFPWPAAIGFAFSAFGPIVFNCYLLEITKSLLPLILVHFASNSIWAGHQWIWATSPIKTNEER